MAVTTRNTLGKGAKVFLLAGQLIIEIIMNFHIIREIMMSIQILIYCYFSVVSILHLY